MPTFTFSLFVKEDLKYTCVESVPHSCFDSVWRLIYSPNDEKREPSDLLMQLRHRGHPVRIHYKISLKGSSSGTISKSGEHCFNNNSSSCNVLSGQSHPFNIKSSLKDFELECTLSTVTDYVGTLLPAKTHVQDKLRCCFEQSKYTDFTIKVGTSRFDVHKVMLATHSRVFEAMLDAPMQESALNEVTIDDFSEEVVRCFLNVLYTVPQTLVAATRETVIEVLRMADKYDATYVAIAASESIRDAMTTDNCLTGLLLAEELQNVQLKERALTYIKTNIKEVMRKHQSTMFEKLGPLVVTVLGFVSK